MQNRQEIHEAIQAADDALIALRRAEKYLSGAAGWGVWDVLGGGFLATFFKHNKINQAQYELENAQYALRRFQQELSDLNQSANLNIGDFLCFTDYFFDDFFSDLLVQSKIRQGQRQLRQTIERIEEIKRRLWNMIG